MHLRVSGQWVLFPLGPKCTIRFCRGAPAPLRQSVHVGTPQSPARHTIYGTHVCRHISIVVSYQKLRLHVHRTLMHKTPLGLYGSFVIRFCKQLQLVYHWNGLWIQTSYKELCFYSCSKRSNTMPPIDGIMVSWFLMMSWYHGITVS